MNGSRASGGWRGERWLERGARGWLAFVLGAWVATDAAGGPADSREFDRARAAVVRAAVGRVSPSIVTIETVGGTQPAGGETGGVPPRGPQSAGGFRVADGPTTGLVWSPDGWIITASFNFVREPLATTVLVPSRDPGRIAPRRHAARLVARDLIRRIALLKIDAEGLASPEWAPEGECRVGQYAIACGRGFGPGLPPPGSPDASAELFPAIHVGIVSAIGRRNGHAVQTDAKTSPANYGGPLVDVEGRVIGVLVPLAGAGDEMAGVEWYDSGIGFAVTRASIGQTIERLMRGENIEPGKMGVLIADAADGRCRVAAVADPSPAKSAGIVAGDVIVGFDDQPVGDRAELLRRISDRAAGEAVRIGLERSLDGERRVLTLVLARAADIGPLRPVEPEPVEQTPEP